MRNIDLSFDLHKIIFQQGKQNSKINVIAL